jgi:hypothetical protein
MSETADSPVPAALAMARLRALRMSLLPLHRALLEHERVRYERAHGRIESAHEALRLVMQDAWFAWVRPLATLIVRADQRMADEAPVQAGDVQMFRDEIRGLLLRDLGGETFHDLYRQTLQTSAEVVIAHGRVMALLGSDAD